MQTDQNHVMEPIHTAPPEVQEIIEKVWQIEKRRLAQKSFSHINDDILLIIKEAVK